MKRKIETICCNKEMIWLRIVDHLNTNTLSCERFVCGECGIFKDIHRYVLDDEELLNEIEQNRELHNTIIHKTLLKEMKSFSVSGKDLFDKKKNPNLSLSPKDILNNKKIEKRVL